MFKKVFCFLFFFCFFREEKTELPDYDSVTFKSYNPSLADEPRCSIHRNKDFKKAA